MPTRVAHGPTFLIDPRAVRAEYNSLRAPRAGNLGRTPGGGNRDDVFNCHEVPIKEYLRKWNFVSFHLFAFVETHSHKRVPLV